MSGTKIGGVKAAKTNRLKWGEDFYKAIGTKGGSVKVPKGFAVSGLASVAGAKGGAISRRGKAKEMPGIHGVSVVEIEQPSDWWSKIMRRLNV